MAGSLTYEASECGRIPTSAEWKNHEEILRPSNWPTQSILPSVTAESLKRGLIAARDAKPSSSVQVSPMLKNLPNLLEKQVLPRKRFGATTKKGPRNSKRIVTKK